MTALLSLIILFAPGDDVPSAPPGVDKIVHVTLFAALAVTGIRARLAARLLAPALLAYAAISEVIQAMPLLGRSASLTDLLADAVGVAVGCALAMRAARR